MYDLMELIRRNENTEFGREYNFYKIKCIADFQANIPILSYDDYAPFIEKIADGEDNILTAERVLLLEPSSGSTSASKLIPYTLSLKNEFLTGLTLWFEDLQKNFPTLFDGEIYFSISPPVERNKMSKGGIPIGFEGDEEYLGKFAKQLKFCVPNNIKNEKIEYFIKKSFFYLMNADDLRFISVWNPTFLIMLAEQVPNPQALFPNLQVISCWGDSNSKPHAEKLQAMFPDAYIQPKGLLATEGIMTVPLEGIGKKLTNAHFFEFLDGNSKVYLADELEAGKVYDIILTTGGGFYRYKIGDLVQYKGDGCFDFIGKSCNISDLFGEKLNEQHVKDVIADKGFRLLVPSDDRYILYTETDADVSTIEKGLRENFHYDYCRNLGQLKEVAVVKIANAEKQYIANCLRFGMRLGDIKPTYLSNRKVWVFV